MHRRKFVVGLGTLIGSAGLGLGTGAFTAAEASRKSDIKIVNDSDGLVGLVPNQKIAGVTSNPGQLTIDIGENDPGVNVNSVYQFGAFFSDYNVNGITGDTFSVVTDQDPANLTGGQDSLESAFAIVNRSSEDMYVTLNFELNSDTDGDGTVYAFELQSSKTDGGSREGITKSPITGEIEGRLNVGESFGVSFIVNALEGVSGDEISGSLSISAVPI